MTFSVKDLESIFVELNEMSKEDETPLAELLDARYIDTFENNSFIHQIFDRYIKKTTTEQEKEQLLTLLQTVIDNGANVNRPDRDKKTLYYKAIKHNEWTLVDYLETTEKIEYNKSEGQTLFWDAVNNKDNKIINHLIKKKHDSGLVPLHGLCSIGNIDLFNSVIDSLKQNKIKIDFDIQDSQGNTALHLACHPWSEPKLPVVDWLLKNKIKHDIRNKWGEYATHIAIENNRADLIELLLKHQVDFTLVDSLGRTPFMKMLTRPGLGANMEILGLLSNIKPQTNQQTTTAPIQLAYEKGFWIRQIGAHARPPQEAITREKEILTEREKLSSEDLLEHIKQPKEHEAYNFSPATFVKAGIPISLFKQGSYFGVIIQTDHLIPCWYSGWDGERMSNSEINFRSKPLKFQNIAEEHQCNNKNSNEIAQQLHRLYQQKMKTYSLRERYEHIGHRETLSWNEGLFRYKKSDIKAFCIGSKEEDGKMVYDGLSLREFKLGKMAYYGLLLRNELQLTHLPFFQYNEEGSIEEIPEQEVQQLAKLYNDNKNKSADNRYGLLNTAGKSRSQSSSSTNNEPADEEAMKTARVP
ncbi:MAG: ankyrin repeat domain-containing protein [Legionella sp.]